MERGTGSTWSFFISWGLVGVRKASPRAALLYHDNLCSAGVVLGEEKVKQIDSFWLYTLSKQILQVVYSIRYTATYLRR